MTSFINCKDTLFKESNLTPIWGEPTLKTLHNIRNEIKANTKSVYYNLGGGSHDYLCLVLTDSKYALISKTTFVYPTHLYTIIILDKTINHKNYNMKIAHTEEVLLFRKVTGVEQDLVQQIVATAEEAYLADIFNCTTNPINDTVSDVITHLQEKYCQLMHHELLECKEIVKKTT